jgi:murein DD-endopeptidase
MCSTIARSKVMKKFLLIFLTIIPILSLAQSRAPLIQSVDVQIPIAPTPVAIAGQKYLGYEIHITNFRTFDIALTQLEILNADDKSEIAKFQDSELNERLGRPGFPDLQDKRIITPGSRAVAFLWLPIDTANIPTRLQHKIEFDLNQSTGRQHGVIEDLMCDIRKENPVVLNPPLKDGPWAALYDPQMEHGHRTSIYTINGHARIPARFAIDWIRLNNDATHAKGDDSKISNWYGYGADVLAVADAIVAEALDDITEDALISSEKRVPLENASGNYIALDLGSGRYAFYEHLKHGSIQVKRGDKVKSGQVIAQLGNSGSSSAGPHLHFHVSDRNSELGAEGLPYVFAKFQVIGAYEKIDSFETGEHWKPAFNGGKRNMELPAPNTVVMFSEK